MSETPLPCPERAAFALALEQLERHREAHADYAAARMRLEVFREVNERLHDELPCHPSVNSDGQLVCSLAAVHQVVMDAALGPVNRGLWAIPLGDAGVIGAML